ncbi:glycosyl transferase family 2 [Mucilaginibacter yixingensis]|uniref:Glycosyl transferase family 2 n=1 Tax=Mucilaginibacter yixingensis TaxID=1295612 RepID=A0A2T5JGY2_9SPHI|nr:glycosyltransferase [Mucilaginibacter yixingensis]PTR01626.1 glycosyl transferase family 2 [Mucilaginibacter yixingensis]
MSSPIHTFVIAAYGESAFLDECVRSLLAQRVRSDVLIATSTPNEHIKNIAQKYGLKLIVNPGSQQSIAADWNFAIASANTSWVTIAHQDDVYAVDYVEQLISAIEACPSQPLLFFTNYNDIVNGGIRRFSANAVVKRLLLYPFWFGKCISSAKTKQRLLHWGNPICCPSVAFNKELLGNFKFSADYSCALDWLAWYQLAQQPGVFLYADKKLVSHRIHPENETSAQIKSGVRRHEEQQIFELMWGKRFARMIGKVYAMGHRENLNV